MSQDNKSDNPPSHNVDEELLKQLEFLKNQQAEASRRNSHITTLIDETGQSAQDRLTTVRTINQKDSRRIASALSSLMKR